MLRISADQQEKKPETTTEEEPTILDMINDYYGRT
ncbi:BH1747 [Halalkalibacterium halodurans C-125]|jgi:hypothetical protein|uniref:BH1747 protein n=1 Tax=Halalkalibacterium halodurans (strain ATCC BAA-125 / DSM 18197 / FERM 7344 / JCM 9153 / C-125) TaxID=272558 RepID=Q9KC27_HALH5|nr:BH1747 [Halalkalibacterium halodurans C-125]